VIHAYCYYYCYYYYCCCCYYYYYYDYYYYGSWRVISGKPSAVCQPTWPTQSFILLWSINE